VKKALLILSALLMVVSGVAAVSAYEAHIVNVTAHVENALVVPEEYVVGTVFPEEVVQWNICWALSESFIAQDRVEDVKYALFWEDKEIDWTKDPDACDPDDNDLYEPLWPYITLSTGDTNDWVGTVAPLPGAVAWGVLINVSDNTDCWHFRFDVPVFDDWYNPTTDPKVPSGILDDTQYCVVEETYTAPDGTVITGDVPHADLGSDLKIQVYEYSYPD
jgi:hypothetical protein